MLELLPGINVVMPETSYKPLVTNSHCTGGDKYLIGLHISFYQPSFSRSFPSGFLAAGSLRFVCAKSSTPHFKSDGRNTKHDHVFLPGIASWLARLSVPLRSLSSPMLGWRKCGEHDIKCFSFSTLSAQDWRRGHNSNGIPSFLPFPLTLPSSML